MTQPNFETLAERARALGLPVYWLGLGRVTDPAAHDDAAPVGALEWQFSDAPAAGARGCSYDYLDLAAGLAALSPCVIIPDGLAADLADLARPETIGDSAWNDRAAAFFNKGKGGA